MSINVTCQHCGTQTQADEKYAGTSGPCRSCGQTLTIPANPFATEAVVPAQQQPTNSSNTWVFVVAILGVVGGGVVGGIPRLPFCISLTLELPI